MEIIKQGLNDLIINILTAGFIVLIGYLYWRFIKAAVKIHPFIIEKPIPEYDIVGGAVKSSVVKNEEGIYFLLKIVNTSIFLEAKDFNIRLLAGKEEKDNKNQESARYVEIEIIYGALTKLGIKKYKRKKKKENNYYYIATTKPLRKILEIYDHLKLIVNYANTINKEFTVYKTFRKENIIFSQPSYDDDLINKPEELERP